MKPQARAGIAVGTAVLLGVAALWMFLRPEWILPILGGVALGAGGTGGLTGVAALIFRGRSRAMEKALTHLGTGDYGYRLRNQDDMSEAFNLAASMIETQDLMHRTHEARLIQIAARDQASRLLNRTTFLEQLHSLTSRMERQDGTASFAVLFLDLDHFKEINDSLGHSVGDQVLSTVSSILESLVRRTDITSLLGDDEFALILHPLDREVNAGLVAQKILDRFNESISLESGDLHVHFSIGIATYPSNGRRSEDLIRNADTALTEAKKERNCFRFFTEEMQKSAIRRMNISKQLFDALIRREFDLHFQPVISRDLKIRGAEILLRWHNFNLGTVAPDDFIPIAEEKGLIRDIGRWVIQNAMERIESWDLDPKLSLKFAINLSIKQLEEKNLTDFLIDKAVENSRWTELLGFEITETILSGHKVMDKIHKLTEAGYQFSLDDFGTGYSSLHRMMEIPFSTLKIDKTLIKNLDTQPRHQLLASNLIRMAHDLSIRVVAEGVETQKEFQLLSEMNCDLFQGYLFSRPLTEIDFLQYIVDISPPKSPDAPKGKK